MVYLEMRFILSGCLLQILTSGLMMTMDANSNWTFLLLLQEVCPYTSFCELEPAMSIPDNYTRRPCCQSCSCKPDCEEFNNCCFDYLRSNRSRTLVQCMSPVVSRTKILPTQHYTMTYSCSGAASGSMCVVNDTNHKSFAPVTSNLTGVIYVNADCASCNDAHNVIPWDIAIKCPLETDDHSFDTVRLIQGEDIGKNGCHMVYIPPEHTNAQARECTLETIRKCNVTRAKKQHEWEPWWDYCPMFNATYSNDGNVFFGNVFCHGCNGHSLEINKCDGGYDRRDLTSPLTAILDGSIFQAFKANKGNEKVKRCLPEDTLEQAIQSRCQRKLCSTGKIQIGNKCGFYSKEWIGGPFIVYLKLTPVGNLRLALEELINLSPEIRHDPKARWLKRKTMKRWNTRTLYYEKGNFIEYLFAIFSYPGTRVDPSRLENILQRTLKETWQIETTTNSTVSLRVAFSTNTQYNRYPKSDLETHGHKLNTSEKFVFVSGSYKRIVTTDLNYLLPIHYPDFGKDYYLDGIYDIKLNALFLCEQFELYAHEFIMLQNSQTEQPKIVIMDINKTLHDSQYRLLNSGSVGVCEYSIIESKGLNLECSYIFCIFTVVLYICCTKFRLTQLNRLVLINALCCKKQDGFNK